MSAIRFDYDVSLCLEAPFSVPGGQVGAMGLDVALARNFLNQVIIPAPHLKGVLREACRDLVNAVPNAKIEVWPVADLIEKLFGPDFGSTNDFDPIRGLIVFGDLYSVTAPTSEVDRNVRVAIDAKTGAAKEGHLLFVESPWKPGQIVSFVGRFSLQSADQTLALATTELLQRALERVVAIGGAKSAGFGFVTSPEIKNPRQILPCTVKSAPARLEVEYKIDRPFIVDAKRFGSNLSVGSEIIPGSAIKSVVAKSMANMGWLDESLLARTRFSHAVPGSRNTVLPKSLFLRGRSLYCALGQEDLGSGVCFCADWKDQDKDAVRAKLGLKEPYVKKYGLTRTSIDPEVATARYQDDAGGALFSQVAIDPRDNIWTGDIAFPDENGFGERVLSVLKAGCIGLGKTKAELRIVETREASVTATAGIGPIAVTLVTPAALFPAEHTEHDAPTLYQKFFEAYGIELIDFFASQSLVGDYLAVRYKRRLGTYLPWVLTDAGSVFLIEPVKGSDGLSAINDALCHGLQPHPDLSRDWKKMPFQRENGFGQLRLNHVNHTALRHGIKISTQGGSQ